MPLVQGKCENCGGILTVDSNLKAANCPFCGVAYIVQDSINNYNTTIHNVETLHADVVTVMDESSSEARLKAGFAYVKIGKFDLAETEFRFVIKVAPQNHLGWLGLVEALTNYYTKRIRSLSELCKIDEYAKSASTLAPNGTGNALITKWISYKKSEEDKNEAEKAELLNKIKELENELNSLEKDENELSERNSQYSQEIAKLNNLDYRSGCGFGLGLLLGIVGVNTFLFSGVFKGDPSFPYVIVCSLVAAAIGISLIVYDGMQKHKSDVQKANLDLLNAKISEIEKESVKIQEERNNINLKINKIQQQLVQFGYSNETATKQIIRVGGEIFFGTNKGQRISWKVIKIRARTAFIICSQNICDMPYNKSKGSGFWPDCTLRKWLNKEFVNKSFTDEEKERIIPHELFDVNGKTTDKVFVLSISEVKNQLSDVQLRANGSWWWLRSTESGYSAPRVSSDGTILESGYNMNYTCGVRPAMWISIE